MVPRVVQDAGYTAVGLGVLALQQVQTRRRQLAQKLGTVTKRLPALADLPTIPGPIGRVVEQGKTRLVQALR